MWLTLRNGVTPRASDVRSSFMRGFMESYKRPIVRILRLLAALTSCGLTGFASLSQQIQPVATLDLSAVQLYGGKQPAWTTVAFTSDTRIAVSHCQGGCSLSLIQWDGEVLRVSAQTVTGAGAVSIYPANEGLIFSAGNGTPMVLYSPDLSTSHDLPSSISMFSASGITGAEVSGDKWKIYRFKGTLQLALEGTGHLQSISDEIRVVQDGNVMNLGTQDGTRLGSFSIPSVKGCASFVRVVAENRLYLNDCKVERIVDFAGKTLLQLSPPKGCCFSDDMWSVDGKRLLFDYRDRKVFRLQNAGEVVRMFATLGMSGQEWPNREEVRVFDTLTGKHCLEWHRTFEKASDVAFGRTAAISPSGQFVAVVAKNKLSIYRLPVDCDELASSAR